MRTQRRPGLLSGRAFVPILYALILVVVYAPMTLLGRSLQAPLFYDGGLTPGGVHDSPPSPTFNVDLGTPAYYEWPVDVAIGNMLRSGDLPFWNPYQGAGAPLAAQYSSRAFFPYQILQDLAPVWTWDFFTLGRLWVAAVLTFWFLRVARVSRVSAFTGGLLYMLGGSFGWFANLEQLANVAMVTPGLLLAVECFWRCRWGAATAATAVAVALILLAGQPESALFSLLLGGAYGAFRLATSRPLLDVARRAGGGLLGVVLGVGLAAPLLLPFANGIGDSHNIHPAGGSLAMQSPTDAAYAVALAVPSFFERREEDRQLPDNGYWDTLGGYAGAVEVALIVVGLSLVARPGSRQPRGHFLLFAGFVTVVLLKDFGVPGLHDLGRLPLLDQAWSQRWAGPAWTLAAACASAFAIDALRHRRHNPLLPLAPRRRTRFWKLLATGGAALVMAALAWEALQVHDVIDQRGPAAEAYRAISAWVGIEVAAVFAAAIAVLAVRYVRTGAGLLLLPALAMVELWYLLPRGYDVHTRWLMLVPLAVALAAVAALGFRRIPWALGAAVAALALFVAVDTGAAHRLPARRDPAAAPAYVAFLREKSGTNRVMGFDGYLAPNFASATGLRDVHYITALEPESFHRYRSLLLQEVPVLDEASSSLWFTGLWSQDYSFDGLGVRLSKPGTQALLARLPYYSLLGVRYVVTPSGPNGELGAPFGLVYDDGYAHIYENPKALGRAFVVHDVLAVDDNHAAFDTMLANRDRLDRVAVVERPLSRLPQGGAPEPAAITRDGVNRVDVTADLAAPGLLVLADTYTAGWSASVDGHATPIYRTDGALRGVPLAAGHHTVVFTYSPPGFRIGLGLAALALVVVVALLAWPRVRTGQRLKARHSAVLL